MNTSQGRRVSSPGRVRGFGNRAAGPVAEMTDTRLPLAVLVRDLTRLSRHTLTWPGWQWQIPSHCGKLLFSKCQADHSDT